MRGRGTTLAIWACLLVGTGAYAAPDAEGSRPLPFRALTGPGDRFTASDLTAAYEKDPTSLLSDRGPRIDLQRLDRHGRFPYGDVPLDPTQRSLVERALPQDVAEVSPTEKDALSTPTAGAYVGIPSAVAATGAFLGGLVLLVKILTLGI